MKKLRKIIVLVLCVAISFTVCACSDGNFDADYDLSAPTNSGYWVKPENTNDEISWNKDLTPNITITQIGESATKDEIISDVLSDDSGIYDIVYENVAYTLQCAGFTTSGAVAINFDDENGDSALGLMYYYDDLNLFATDEYYAAGFYEIIADGEESCNFEDVELLYLKDIDDETQSSYLGVYDYQDISYDHFVYNDKYIIYYQESNNTIRYTEQENIRENYDLTLGSLYDYDNKHYIYDDSYFEDYQNHSAVELFNEEDYAKLEAQLTEISQTQLENGYEVSEFKIVYISPESIQAYLASEEESTFFGYRVEDLTATFGLGTALKYTANGFEEAIILEESEIGYDWKSFLIKMGIGTGIIIVGAVLSPLTGGASFGCALVTISKCAIGFAFTSALGTLAMDTVTGLISGQSIEESLRNATYSGLDAFADGFMIGAAVGSVGVCTGLIKPKACFVAGTSIALGNGVYKNIENINVGDYVLSYNEQTKEVSKQQVSDIFSKEVCEIIELNIGGETIQTTTNHPFYLPLYDCWVKAESLKAGDYVLSANKTLTMVENCKIVSKQNGVKVYNFTVDNNHTYFVGTYETLVHNSCNKLTDREVEKYRYKAGKQAKKEALNDLINGRNLKKWGLDMKNPDDMEILKFIQQNKRFPSFKANDKIQCEFAHAVDVSKIRQAFEQGKITKQQAIDFISNPKNGILTSHNNHFILHKKNWSNVTDVKTAIKLRPSIKNTVEEILKAIA